MISEEKNGTMKCFSNRYQSKTMLLFILRTTVTICKVCYSSSTSLFFFRFDRETAGLNRVVYASFFYPGRPVPSMYKDQSR